MDTPSTHHEEIAARVAARARACRLSARAIVRALADRGVEISRSSVNYWLSGERLPALELLGPLAEVLECDPAWLLTGREPAGDGLSDDERHVLTIARHLGVREAIDRLLLNRVEPPTPQDDPRLTGRLLPPAGSGGGEGTGRKNHGA